MSLDCLARAVKDYSSWPPTYQQIMCRHEYLQMAYQRLSLGGAPDPELKEPMIYREGILIYHLSKMNIYGESLLCRFDFEKKKILEEIDCNIGTFFLRVLANLLGMKV